MRDTWIASALLTWLNQEPGAQHLTRDKHWRNRNLGIPIHVLR